MKRVQCLLAALAAVIACAVPLKAQQATGTVSGRVVDAELLAPLPDVTITIADRTVLGDSRGYFTVTDVPVGIHTLRATLIGYRAAETQVTVTAGGTTSVEIQMRVAPMEMAPIVAVGYGTLQRSENTGVVAEVPSETFNPGLIVTAEELIKGKVAGVQVTENNGGEPGGGVSMRIRGGTSVTSSNEPLYVIDGVPLEVGGGLGSVQGNRSPLTLLNPDDIASFTVLKDASATAIYGSRGANGVVLIETTAGRQAAGAGARVAFRANFSGATVAGKPDIMNASQFRSAVTDQAPSSLPLLGTANTDWYDQVTRSGYSQDYSVAVAGGGEKMDFRASLGYLDQQGIVDRTGVERATLNLSYNQLLFDDRLSLQAKVLGARTEEERTGSRVVGSATNMAPTQPIYDPDSEYGGYWEWSDPLGTNNPVGEMMLVTDQGVAYQSVGNLTAQYSLPWLSGLSATGRFGYTVLTGEGEFFAPSIAKYQNENGQEGFVSRANAQEFSYLGDAFLTYTGTWGEHGLTATGGYSYQQWRLDDTSMEAQQLGSDLLGPNGIPSYNSDLARLWLNVEENKLASWFGRANYTFRDRYVLTATVRADGSSRFGEDNRWATFPSFAGAWRVSEESFMDGADWLSDLRLRVSWGKNGNQAFDDYQQYKTYAYGENTAQAQFGDSFIPTIRPAAVDPNIRWEETRSWNFGVDFGFSNNRYWGSLEYYTKDTDDLIFDVLVPGGSNLSNVVTTNIGSMKNEGFEATLNAMLIEGGGDGFTWDANFNFAYNKNELTEINPFAAGAEQILAGAAISVVVGTFIQVLEPGQPVNSFFVYEHKLDSSGKPIYGTDLEMYVDQNNDGKIDQDDRRAYNSPAPDWIMGHTSLMRYGSFDLSFTLLAELGNYVYNNVASSTGFYDQLRDAAPGNLHTSVLETGFQAPQYLSDWYVEDASFLRMQNIELGYTFQQALNGVRLYATVENAFTITGYSGVDPTASTDGIDNNRYPRTRTFTAGLNVVF